jgi:xylose isomerase
LQANLFSHPRYANGAATNPDAHVLAYAGAQVTLLLLLLLRCSSSS